MANDCGAQQSGYVVSCPDVTEYWVPAGTYALTEYLHVSEVNNDPLYVPCHNAWSLPPKTVVITPGQTVDFGDGSNLISSANTCTPGSYSCGTAVSKCRCTITAPSSVCSGSTDNTASVSSTSGATYTWSIINGTITAGTGTRTITWTAGKGGPAHLSVSVTSSSCSKTCTKDVLVEPSCTITASSSVCSGSTDNTASVEDAGYGATYDWSINGGSITAGTGANEITWTAGDAGTTQISVTVTDSNGCSTTCTKDVSVKAPPDCTITSASPVSSGSSNTASVQDAGTGATYDWSINGGSITAGTGANEITWTAGDAGTTQISVTVTDSNGCSTTCTKDVTVATPVNNQKPAEKKKPGITAQSNSGKLLLKSYLSLEYEISGATITKVEADNLDTINELSNHRSLEGVLEADQLRISGVAKSPKGRGASVDVWVENSSGKVKELTKELDQGSDEIKFDLIVDVSKESSYNFYIDQHIALNYPHELSISGTLRPIAQPSERSTIPEP